MHYKFYGVECIAWFGSKGKEGKHDSIFKLKMQWHKRVEAFSKRRGNSPAAKI